MRAFNDINWYKEAHKRSVDVNPNSNGSIPSGLNTVPSQDMFDTSVLSDVPLPEYKSEVKGSPYVRHIKEYENIVNAIANEDQHTYVTEALSHVFEHVLSMGASDNPGDGIASLNQVSRNSTYKRQAPAFSPSKFRKG